MGTVMISTDDDLKKKALFLKSSEIKKAALHFRQPFEIKSAVF